MRIMGFMLSNSLVIKGEGINNGDEGYYWEGGEKDPESAQKAGRGNNNSAYAPKPSCKAVGFVPVLLAVKSPGEFETNGVILLAFGKIVSDDDEDQSEKCGYEKLDANGSPHCGGIHERGERNAQYGNDPEDEMQYFFGMVLLFRIGKCEEDGKPMDRDHDHGHEENGEGFGRIAVDLTVYVPMRRDLRGELFP
jgi:hypothetical protein